MLLMMKKGDTEKIRGRRRKKAPIEIKKRTQPGCEKGKVINAK